LFCQGIDTYSSPNTAANYRVELWNSFGAPSSVIVPLDGSPQEGIPCYPANLVNSLVGSMPDPSGVNGWRYYRVSLQNASSQRVSKFYYFYNAELYGQYDCRYNNVRVAWVSSRGGWDYFNFIKKSEVTNQIERKQFKRVLMNGTASIFSRYDRQNFDRANIVTRTITINSDWVQENEYIFLRSLLVSNQVHIVNSDGTHIPVSVEEKIELLTRLLELMNGEIHLIIKTGGTEFVNSGPYTTAFGPSGGTIVNIADMGGIPANLITPGSIITGQPGGLVTTCTVIAFDSFTGDITFDAFLDYSNISPSLVSVNYEIDTFVNTIEQTFVDLYPLESISQNFIFQDAGTFAPLGDFTREFRVPASDRNLEIFGLLDSIGI